MKKTELTPRLRNNWLIDAVLFIGAVLTFVTSIYFLILPVGGYMGGRNPNYGIVFIFERSGWEWLHDWGGILMIVASLVHIIIHWKWITQTTMRVFKNIKNKREKFGPRLTWNIILDTIILISFLVCTISGLFFFFNGKYVVKPFIFNSLTWDLIHTWSGILMAMAAILHFMLHWKWIVKVTQKVFRLNRQQDIQSMVGRKADLIINAENEGE